MQNVSCSACCIARLNSKFCWITTNSCQKLQLLVAKKNFLFWLIDRSRWQKTATFCQDYLHLVKSAPFGDNHTLLVVVVSKLAGHPWHCYSVHCSQRQLFQQVNFFSYSFSLSHSYSCYHCFSYLLAILGMRGERGSEEKMERLGLLVLPPPLPCPSILRGLVMRPAATPAEAEARGRGSTMRISWLGGLNNTKSWVRGHWARAANGMSTWLGRDRKARHRSHEAVAA